MSEVTYGKRIKYQTTGKQMISHKIFSNGEQMLRVIINKEDVTFVLIDPVTHEIQASGGEGINNLEVLQRHVKAAITEILGVGFEKEKRTVNE